MINQAEKPNNNHSEKDIEIPETNSVSNSDSENSEDKHETNLSKIPEITTGISIEQDPKKIFNYINKTSMAYILISSFMIAATFFYLIDEKTFKKMFKNYCRIGNGYDYTATALLTISLLIPTISTKLGRALQIPLFTIMVISYIYLPAFILRIALKEEYNTSEWFVTIFPICFCSAISLLIGNYFSKDKFNYKIGTRIGSLSSIVLIACYIWVFEVYDPYMWQILLMMAMGAFWAFYVNYDAYLMSKRRRHVYRPNDWFLGVAHLQTDIFFRFWYDMFLEFTQPEEKIEQDFVNDGENFDDEDEKHTELIITTQEE